MANLKRNHCTPEFILKHWLSAQDGRHILHLYEIGKKLKGTRGANNKFKFAARTDLYVPQINSQRDTKMEEWFSRCENALASLVQAIANNQTPINIKPREHNYIEKAIHGLRYRSRYDIETIRRAVETDDKLRGLVTCHPNRSIERITLENIRNTIEHDTLKMHPLSLSFMHVEEGSLLLSDRAWLDFDLAESKRAGGKFVILTNRVALHYMRSTRGHLEYQRLPMPNDARDILNENTALQARDWLVADNEQLLDQYIDVVKSPRWESAKNEDHLVGVVPLYLRGGASSSRTIPLLLPDLLGY